MIENRTFRSAAALCAAALAGVLLAIPAWATWTSPTTASMSVSTATLAAPTGLSAVNGTCTTLPPAQAVNLSWTATTSTFATGYEIFRGVTSGGPYVSIGTVSGLSTVTYTDATVLASTTYYYVVQASVASWRSVNSGQASVTTRTVLCA